MTRILITGAGGAVGQALLRELGGTDHEIIATDIRALQDLPDNCSYRPLDVRNAAVDQVIGETRPQVIVHLASIVSPPKGSTRAFEYAVDVTGTQNIIEASIAHGVERLVVTSSGAAYGYHADNPLPLCETDAVRGNMEFAYAHHKRLVEEMLEKTRRQAPFLPQVVLRVGTVLGAGMENQITALFHRKRLLAISSHESPFVFIWTQDLARILVRAATASPAGIFNVAGDGAMGITQIADVLQKPVMRLPAFLLKAALALAHPLGLSRYGPQQVRFLQYRPVLDNTKLKQEFGYTPEKTSAETFDLWRRSAGL